MMRKFSVPRELLLDLVERLPQGTVSRAWGWLARRKHPRAAVNIAKHMFVKTYGIDMNEATESTDSYACLEDLFVRRLRPGMRRIDPQPTAVVSPVDGVVGTCGKVTHGTVMQVKGREYSVERLLGDADEAARFEGGSYATFYLAPKDYHRIHAPISGEIHESMLIPGHLLPVFPESLERFDELFARNERLITFIDGATADVGRVAVVKVGATMVGKITLAYDPDVWTNRRGQGIRRSHYSPARLIQKGAEVGAFELGSTVVLLAERGKVDFSVLHPGMVVKMGQRIGNLAVRANRPRTVGAPGAGNTSSGQGNRRQGRRVSPGKSPTGKPQAEKPQAGRRNPDKRDT